MGQAMYLGRPDNIVFDWLFESSGSSSSPDSKTDPAVSPTVEPVSMDMTIIDVPFIFSNGNYVSVEEGLRYVMEGDMDTVLQTLPDTIIGYEENSTVLTCTVRDVFYHTLTDGNHVLGHIECAPLQTEDG